MLTGSQIQSLVFPDTSRTPRDRAINRLIATHLIVKWNLRRPGNNGGAEIVYKRVGKRVLGIPDHTLAVGDIFVTLKELERAGRFVIEDYEVEARQHGLNPDLHIRLTASKAVELHFEADLGTERLPQLRGKLEAVCGAYSSVEGVELFPLTIYVTTTQKRATAIKGLVDETPVPELFRVATFDTLYKQLHA